MSLLKLFFIFFFFLLTREWELGWKKSFLYIVVLSCYLCECSSSCQLCSAFLLPVCPLLLQSSGSEQWALGLLATRVTSSAAPLACCRLLTHSWIVPGQFGAGSVHTCKSLPPLGEQTKWPPRPISMRDSRCVCSVVKWKDLVSTVFWLNLLINSIIEKEGQGLYLLLFS